MNSCYLVQSLRIDVMRGIPEMTGSIERRLTSGIKGLVAIAILAQYSLQNLRSPFFSGE